MSLTGRARILGSTFTRYRSVTTLTANGTATRTWSATLPGLQLLVRPLDVAVAQRLWGQESAETDLCRAPAGTDLAPGDILVGTAGPKAGVTYRIERATPALEGPPHLVLGLVQTNEQVP